MTNTVDRDLISVSSSTHSQLFLKTNPVYNIIQGFQNLQVKTNEQKQESGSRKCSNWFVMQGGKKHFNLIFSRLNETDSLNLQLFFTKLKLKTRENQSKCLLKQHFLTHKPPSSAYNVTCCRYYSILQHH